MALKMNIRIITKNHAADPEIGFIGKSISKSDGCATAMPAALELKNIILKWFVSKNLRTFVLKWFGLKNCLEIPVPQFSFRFVGPWSTYDAKWEISEHYVLPV